MFGYIKVVEISRGFGQEIVVQYEGTNRVGFGAVITDTIPRGFGQPKIRIHTVS